MPSLEMLGVPLNCCGTCMVLGSKCTTGVPALCNTPANATMHNALFTYFGLLRGNRSALSTNGLASFVNNDGPLFSAYVYEIEPHHQPLIEPHYQFERKHETCTMRPCYQPTIEADFQPNAALFLTLTEPHVSTGINYHMIGPQYFAVAVRNR